MGLFEIAPQKRTANTRKAALFLYQDTLTTTERAMTEKP